MALRELESFTGSRVRSGGAETDRRTGNLVAALFSHDTCRALDPHVHTHCIVFNATFDPVENPWKAIQNRDMLRAKKLVEQLYYHELSRDLKQLGYSVSNRSRGDFESAREAVVWAEEHMFDRIRWFPSFMFGRRRRDERAVDRGN